MLLFLLHACQLAFSHFLFLVSSAESNPGAALRNACIKRLRQIYTGLQTSNDTQTPLKQTDHQPQPHISSQTAVRYKHQLEQCSLLLLTHLMELQEVQATTLLPALKDEVSQTTTASNQKITQSLNKAPTAVNYVFPLECRECPSSAR